MPPLPHRAVLFQTPEDDHSEHRLIFSLALALDAQRVGFFAWTQEGLYDPALQFPIDLSYLHYSARGIRLIIDQCPATDR